MQDWVDPRARLTDAARSGAGVAWAGLVSLAVGMGVGRFAFTPLLPMMLSDGVLTLAAASAMASANYLGYLVGALACTVQPWLWRHRPAWRALDPAALVRGGLVATSVLTMAMAVAVPALWPALRFAAGAASAVVLVHTSGWCLSRLAERGASALGGVVFAGPGAGIVVSGLLASAMVACGWRGAAGWWVFGALALALTVVVWPRFAPQAAPGPMRPVPAPAPPGTAHAHTDGAASAAELAALALAYGLAGFGYIVTATYLPVIARTAVPGSAWLDLFWPIFGVGVVAGALWSTRWRRHGDARWLLSAAYLVQAGGIGLGLWMPRAAGLALGSLLLGMPFTAITLFVLQEVRRQRPRHAASGIGLLTAMFGIGQIAGPAMVSRVLQHSATRALGFDRALQLAIGALLLGAGLHAWAALAHPMRRA